MHSLGESLELVLVLVDDGALRRAQDRVLHFCLRRQVLVKVGQVLLHSWHVGWRDLLGDELLDVQVGEPGVRQDLVDAVRPESLRSILVQQFDDQVLGLGADGDTVAHGVGETHGALTDQEVHPMLVPMEERRDADNHLEDEDAERPPVDGEVVSVADEHFRRQVLRRAAEGIGQLTLLHELGQAKISHK